MFTHPESTFYISVSGVSVMLQVTLSIELNDSQVDEFESLIPVQLAEPPWNYTVALSKGITVCEHQSLIIITRDSRNCYSAS